MKLITMSELGQGERWSVSIFSYGLVSLGVGENWRTGAGVVEVWSDMILIF